MYIDSNASLDDDDIDGGATVTANNLTRRLAQHTQKNDDMNKSIEAQQDEATAAIDLVIEREEQDMPIYDSDDVCFFLLRSSISNECQEGDEESNGSSGRKNHRDGRTSSSLLHTRAETSDRATPHSLRGTQSL
jgi:hypothetical protein